jgi:hypothetical protein
MKNAWLRLLTGSSSIGYEHAPDRPLLKRSACFCCMLRASVYNNTFQTGMGGL